MEKEKLRDTIEDAADNLSRHKPAYSASDINHALILTITLPLTEQSLQIIEKNDS